MWEVAAGVAPQVYVVVSSIFAARYLGAPGVGKIALIAFVAFTVGTVPQGLSTATLRFIGELVGGGKGAEAHALYRWAWKVHGAIALTAMLIMFLIALTGATPRAAWALAGISAAGAVMNSIQSSFLRGLQRWRDARIVGIVSGSVALGLKIVVLVLGGGISLLFAVDALTVIANVIGTQRFSRRAANEIPPPAIVRPRVRPVIRFAAVASVNIFVALIVYQRTEVFFLAHYSTDTEIALYSIPFAAVAALILVPRAIGLTLAPAIATLWGGGEVDRIRSGLSRSVRIVVLLNTVVTALAAALMPAAIRLAYGSAFSKSGPVALILLVTVPFVPLGALSMSLLVGIGRQWAITVVGVVAAVVDVALDWTLIPRYGAIGAAVANTAAQLTGSIPLALYALGAIGGITLHGRTLLRGIGAAAVAGICAALAAHSLSPAPGLALGLVVFAVTFTLASLVLRPLGSDDARWIDETLGGWAYGLVGLATRSMSVRAPSPP